MSDRKWMRRALSEARQREGFTRPNPPVGAVVVRGDQLIGVGNHSAVGAPHAEVVALRACGARARGATLYVTLEPCSTFGRTPPCTELILREGIKRVVVGCQDENACHAGRGLELLRSRGVEVTCGVCADEARELVLPFFKHVKSGLPFLTLKLAMTMDGCIADRRRNSQWITGPKARALVQAMRRRADVVLVGAGTVCADNPSLLCRLGGSGELRRVVVDGRGTTTGAEQIFTDQFAERTIVATLRQTAVDKGAQWCRNGSQVWEFEPDAVGRVALPELMQRLGAVGYLHVLCEGGGGLAGMLHSERLVDEYAFFYAPCVLGDHEALRGVDGVGTLLAQVQHLRLHQTRKVGDDILMRARTF